MVAGPFVVGVAEVASSVHKGDKRLGGTCGAAEPLVTSGLVDLTADLAAGTLRGVDVHVRRVRPDGGDELVELAGRDALGGRADHHGRGKRAGHSRVTGRAGRGRRGGGAAAAQEDDDATTLGL